jgi:predicted metal-dependent hydrolase
MDKEKLFWQGIEQFNQGEFYECHESLEEIWLAEQSDNRLFYQGLIQVAGGFHHVQKNRLDPARKALPKARKKLENYPSKHHGIVLGELLEEVRVWEANLGLGQSSISSKKFPKIHRA